MQKLIACNANLFLTFAEIIKKVILKYNGWHKLRAVASQI